PQLGPGTARFINWVNSHEGYAAQAGLWFNNPLSVNHEQGTVAISNINERIVETAFALAAAGGLRPGSAVLDVGSAESVMPLHFAALGLDVTAVDPRGYPIDHPSVTCIALPLERWEGPSKLFDAAFCISTVEHIGLGAYDQEHSADP